MANQFSARSWEVIGSLLVVVYFAHILGQVVQIGGAQIAPSVVVYTFLAFLAVRQTGWFGLLVTGILIGLLTMHATTSPYPLANIFSHGGGFLVAALLAKAKSDEGRKIETGSFVATYSLTTVVSWTVFAIVTWIGLGGTEFVQQSWSRFGLEFGVGFLAWWLYGFLGVVIPALIFGFIVTPVLLSIGRMLDGPASVGRSV